MPSPKPHPPTLPGRTNDSDSPVSGLKMKDLTRAAGVTKATVLHYLSLGLLPQPARPGPNTAYYDPICVKKIQIIKQLQSRYRLPLASLKAALDHEEKGRNISSFVELQALVFGREEAPGLNLDRFCTETGLTAEQVNACLKENLLVPSEDGLFDGQDVTLGRIIGAGLQMGLGREDLDYYPRLAGQMVEKEMALRNRMIRNKSFDEAVAVTMDLTNLARFLRSYYLDRLFRRAAAANKMGPDFGPETETIPAVDTGEADGLRLKVK